MRRGSRAAKCEPSQCPSPPKRRLCSPFLLFVLSSYRSNLFRQERITLASHSARQHVATFVIAEEKGFFKGEGVNAIVVIMQNQVVVNGVVARNVDYGGTFRISSVQRSPACRSGIVMSLWMARITTWLASPNVKRVEDLKGKNFGISIGRHAATVKRS